MVTSSYLHFVRENRFAMQFNNIDFFCFYRIMKYLSCSCVRYTHQNSHISIIILRRWTISFRYIHVPDHYLMQNLFCIPNECDVCTGHRMHVNDDEKLLRLIKKIVHLSLFVVSLLLASSKGRLQFSQIICFNIDLVCDCDSHILSIDLHS